jgi:hypothetical protein
MSNVRPLMLATLRFPWIYVLELLLWVPLCAGFVAITAFLGSTPIAELGLVGKSLPLSWEAAVSNHGRFLEGFLIGSPPLAFVGALVLLFGSATVLYLVQRAQLNQLREATGRMANAHRAAQTLVFVAIAITFYLVFTNFLTGVVPA